MYEVAGIAAEAFTYYASRKLSKKLSTCIW